MSTFRVFFRPKAGQKLQTAVFSLLDSMPRRFQSQTPCCGGSSLRLHAVEVPLPGSMPRVFRSKATCHGFSGQRSIIPPESHAACAPRTSVLQQRPLH